MDSGNKIDITVIYLKLTLFENNSVKITVFLLEKNSNTHTTNKNNKIIILFIILYGEITFNYYIMHNSCVFVYSYNV